MDHSIIRPIAIPTFVVAHLETTGDDPSTDGIVDIAFVRFVQGEPAERFVSLVNPRCAVPPPVLRRCYVSASEVAASPSIEALLPTLRSFVGDALIAAHDIESVPASLSAPSDPPWISVRKLAAEAWPLADDYSSDGLRRFLNLEHAALNELPFDRAEGEAVLTGLVLSSALVTLAR